MSVYPPVEILYDRTKVFPGLKHVLDKKCGTSCRWLQFPTAKRTLRTISDNDYFDTKGKAPLEAWPTDLIQHLDEGESKIAFSKRLEIRICLLKGFRTSKLC